MNNRASISSIPIGKGNLIIFGGFIGETRSEIGEDIVARDISKILLSKIIYLDGKIISKFHNRENVINEKISIDIPREKINDFVFVAFSIDRNSYFFFEKQIGYPG